MSAPIQHLLSIPMCGLPCAFCGQPVRLITVYPRGTRTVHEDATRPFCDYLPPPTKPRPRHGYGWHLVCAAARPRAGAPAARTPRSSAQPRKPVRMNSDTSTPPGEPNAAEDNADIRTALVAALDALFEQDERWNSVPSPGGATLTRGWDDGTADTLLILSPDTAYGWREDANGREIVRVRGTAEKVIAAVREWAAPGEPGVPDGSDHAPGPSGVWT